MDKATEQYMNGLRFGFGHARRYGNAALVREACGLNRKSLMDGTVNGVVMLNGSKDYTAGVVDAALAMVQGVTR